MISNRVYCKTRKAKKIIIIIIKVSFSDEKRANRLFQKLLLYNKFIEKPRIKKLETNDLLFYHESTFFLSWIKYNYDFKGI